MMNMQELLTIIIAVLLCIGAFYLICQTKLREKIYALLLDAEKTDEDGMTKFDYVCTNAYDYVPSCFKIFISYSSFKIIVQKLYDKLRDLAKDGKIDGKV